MGLNARNIALLEGRSIDHEIALKLGVNDSERSGFDIQFDAIQHGKVVNHQYRTLAGEKRFSQDTDAIKCFWNYDVLLEPGLRRVIITEGRLDALSAIQSGEPHTMSVPDGAPSAELGPDDTGSKYSYVLNALSMFAEIKEIVLAVDGDPAGHRLLQDLSVRFNPARCKFVRYPEGCKDLNQVLIVDGPDGVREVIRNASWIEITGVYRPSELPPLPIPIPYDTGVPGLEKHFRIRQGDLSVVTGIPGRGKSTFVNQIAAGMMEKWNWRVAMAAFEQRPQIDGRRNFRTLHSGHLERHMTEDQIVAADAWMEDHLLWIYPPSIDTELTIEWLFEGFEACVIRHDCKLLVVDPWNELDHIRPPDMLMTEYVGFAIRQLKRFALRHSVHVMVVAHPAKIGRTKEGKMFKPSLYDIADSAMWYNKPDVGIIVDTLDNGDTTVDIAKSRVHTEIGEPGVVHYTFYPSRGRYDIDVHSITPDPQLNI